MPKTSLIDHILRKNKRIKKTNIHSAEQLLPSTIRSDTQKKVDQYLDAVKDFERDRVAMAKKSEKRAWAIAGGCFALAFLAVGAVIIMLPLKTVEPYLIRVDNNTGFTDLVNPVSNGHVVSYGEALDKFFLSRYVEYRNGYNWKTVQNSYDAVKLMSSAPVFNRYNRHISPNNKNSPINLLKDQDIIKIIVNGETPLVDKKGQDHIAQVRFTREIKTQDGSPAAGYSVSQWIATITYDYKAPITRESERQINPLGFRVTSYREDIIK